MRHETAIGAALERANVDTSSARLFSLATKLIRDAGGDPGLAPALTVNRFLMSVLDDNAMVRALALAYLRDRAADMKGVPKPERDGGGQGDNGHHLDVAKPFRNGASHGAQAHHPLLARPVVEPTSIQKSAAASVKLKMSQTVLDTYKVRDGRAIGDLYFMDIPALRAENAQEEFVLRQIERCAANVAPNTRVRDVVKSKDLEVMIERAKDVANAS